LDDFEGLITGFDLRVGVCLFALPFGSLKLPFDSPFALLDGPASFTKFFHHRDHIRPKQVRGLDDGLAEVLSQLDLVFRNDLVFGHSGGSARGMTAIIVEIIQSIATSSTVCRSS
jgi:hypothetical protein